MDFSQYHPLDHTLSECRGYPGGRYTHLRYMWEFQWREDLVTRWMHLTGRHHWIAFASRKVTRPGVETGELIWAPPEPGDAEGWQYGVSCAGCDATPDPQTRRAMTKSGSA